VYAAPPVAGHCGVRVPTAAAIVARKLVDQTG
jgi:hypothetical protein